MMKLLLLILSIVVKTQAVLEGKGLSRHRLLKNPNKIYIAEKVKKGVEEEKKKKSGGICNYKEEKNRKKDI